MSQFHEDHMKQKPRYRILWPELKCLREPARFIYLDPKNPAAKARSNNAEVVLQDWFHQTLERG